MHTNLILVGRVEGDFADLLVAPANSHNVTQSELHAFKERGLRGVTTDLAFEDRQSVLAGFEFSSVAEGCDLRQRFEARRRTVVLDAGLVFSGIGLDDLIVEPHVRDGHTILGQSARFVGANGRGRAKRLDGLEILDQAILGGHALGREGQAHGDSGQQTLWHVSDDDSDEEDNGVEPVIAQNEGDDEEGDAEEDGDTGDQVDEVVNLLGDWCLTGIKAGGQTGDPSHRRLITTADDHTLGRALDGVRREEREILGFQRVLIRELGRPRLRLGLARQ